MARHAATPQATGVPTANHNAVPRANGHKRKRGRRVQMVRLRHGRPQAHGEDGPLGDAVVKPTTLP